MVFPSQKTGDRFPLVLCRFVIDGCHGHLARASIAALARRQWHPTRQRGFARALTGLLLAGLALATAGCGSQEIDTVYGKRRGVKGGASVNGTGVLAEMFKSYGHRITTRRYLSPKMDEYDVVVWFPNDFEPPTEEQQKFFEDWLYKDRQRTLIYVGRDYDASIDYWQRVLPDIPPEQAVEALRRQAKARAHHDQLRTAMPAEQDCRWFRVSGNGPIRHVGRGDADGPELRGPWCEGGEIDPSQIDILLQGRLEPLEDPPQSEYGGPLRTKDLLISGEDAIVWKVTNAYWDEGSIVVVNNGSFLLNLPLVEHEHRELAGKLIAECGPSKKKVVFLESGAGGPPVYDEEPGENYPTGFEALTVWPIGAVLLHFVVFGTVLLVSLMAIFGRPGELPRVPVSDFGHHIQALGDLLARTQNHTYAEERLRDYHAKVKGESGGDTAG